MDRRSFLKTLGAATLAGPLAGGPAKAGPAQSTDPAAPSFVPPPPFTSPANVYSGISGPGKPVRGDGHGGWRSGPEGVRYQGPDPKPGWTVVTAGLTDDSAVKNGLLPPIKPIWDLHLRDTIICLGGDGHYYMTGSSGDNIWDRNDGVELWRSADLRAWDYLGLVWSIERDGTWEKQWRRLHNKPTRNVWAPEIHYLQDNYFLCLCMAPGGVAILKSKTGKPQGPYVSTLAADKPLVGGIDPTLFQDDDGKVYFANGGGGTIHRMKDDMSGFDGEGHPITLQGPNALGPGGIGRPPNRIGHEGVSLFKANGTYYLGAADTYQGRYSSMVAQSKTLYGPYTLLEEAVPCGAGTNYFRDKEGGWWCAFFGNDGQAPWREKPGLVKIDFDGDGKIVVAKAQPGFVLRSGTRQT